MEYGEPQNLWRTLRSQRSVAGGHGCGSGLVGRPESSICRLSSEVCGLKSVVYIRSMASFIPYRPPRHTPDDMVRRATSFMHEMDGRRSVRDFSPEPVPRQLIELAVATASTAPSGAHRQPWTFAVTDDPAVKRQVRIAAENEERENYEGGRLPEHWREALEPIGTTWQKPFLETAPWLVVLFEQRHGYDQDGSIRKHYYVKESVGIAAGMFIAAVHHMGLATLTHTPSPMAFLRRVMDRPDNERAFCLFPVGYPADDCRVPDLHRKTLDQVMIEATDQGGLTGR